jgi:4,5-DOPA dioxygenase extradiol
MYPEANIPVLQMSIPTHDPAKLFELGERLAPLREHGVLIVGSGFLTHGLPYLRDFRIEATAPSWSVEFDRWAQEAIARNDIDTLMNFKELAPGMPYAHPTVEHLSPIFVTLGAASDVNISPDIVIDGYWMGLAKTSLAVA